MEKDGEFYLVGDLSPINDRGLHQSWDGRKRRKKMIVMTKTYGQQTEEKEEEENVEKIELEEGRRKRRKEGEKKG